MTYVSKYTSIVSPYGTRPNLDNLVNNSTLSINIDNPIDKDWFTIETSKLASGSKSVKLTLSGIPSGDNYKIIVTDSGGQAVGKTDSLSGNTRVVSFDINKLNSPIYYICVYAQTYSATSHTATLACSISQGVTSLAIDHTLRYGETSEQVGNLQDTLMQLGLDIGSSQPDKNFGEKTLSAVTALEIHEGLTIDGLVWTQVRGRINILLKNITPSLKNELSAIQNDITAYRNGTNKLNGMEYLQGLLSGYINLYLGSTGVDGVYGNYTTTAVKAIQKYYGLGVTGTMDSSTWTKLYTAISNSGISGTLESNQLQFIKAPTNIVILSITNNSITWRVTHISDMYIDIYNDAANQLIRHVDFSDSSASDIVTGGLNANTSYRAELHLKGNSQEVMTIYGLTGGNVNPNAPYYDNCDGYISVDRAAISQITKSFGLGVLAAVLQNGLDR